MRVHVFRRNETTFYHNRQAEEAKGEGRANLFEGGEPKGLDFQFECSEKMQTSSGYETFPAKWKKPNQELVVLMPEFGKPGHYNTCNFKVEGQELRLLCPQRQSFNRAVSRLQEVDGPNTTTTPSTARTLRRNLSRLEQSPLRRSPAGIPCRLIKLR